MYLDLEDYRPDTPRVPSVISVREGVLLSLRPSWRRSLLFILFGADRVVRGRCRAGGSRARQQGTDQVRADAARDRSAGAGQATGGTVGHRPPERDAGACAGAAERSAAVARQHTGEGRRRPPTAAEPAASPPAPGLREPRSPRAPPGSTPKRGRRRPESAVAERRPRAPELSSSTCRTATTTTRLAARPTRTRTSSSTRRASISGRGSAASWPRSGATGSSRKSPSSLAATWSFSSPCCGTDRSSILRVSQPAGIDALTVSALNSIKLSNPTAVLPPDFPDDRAPFIVTFRYNEPVRESP